MCKWNWKPYTGSDVENIVKAVVTSPDGKISTAVNSRVAEATGESHQVRVSFPTRKSGVYVVAVRVSEVDLPGSPFSRTVTAG